MPNVHILLDCLGDCSEEPYLPLTAKNDAGWQVDYPLVMTNSLLLKMAMEIVDLPIDSMVDLSIVLLVYQRVVLTPLA